MDPDEPITQEEDEEFQEADQRLILAIMEPPTIASKLGSMRTKRRQSRIDQTAARKYGVRDEDIDKPGFFSFGRLTGRLMLPEDPSRLKPKP